ncbi:MAG: metallophosphoesterase [Trichloromonas sp.]|jgi:Icc-related predicted phosphoesterase|nr:metallophosphoesterase [Trichloromonas sp.]
MRVQFIADLHMELWKSLGAGASLEVRLEAIRTTSADVLVLAGDSCKARRAAEFAADLAQGRPCVLVAGNHEYYGGDLPEDLEGLRARGRNPSNVHVLENESVEIGDVVFLGCTLWSDMRLYESAFGYPASVLAVQAGLNDYRCVTWEKRRNLQTADTIAMHRASVAWLKEQFALYRGRRIVVVTHHAPSEQSVAECYRNDILSAGFASNLDALVKDSGAALWIHGHTHGCCDYVLGDTRVVANACGYPFEQTGFKANRVVEL